MAVPPLSPAAAAPAFWSGNKKNPGAARGVGIYNFLPSLVKYPCVATDNITFYFIIFLFDDIDSSVHELGYNGIIVLYK